MKDVWKVLFVLEEQKFILKKVSEDINEIRVILKDAHVKVPVKEASLEGILEENVWNIIGIIYAKIVKKITVK